MPLPSSIAERMVEKSSSVRIMSAASFATSVPSLPIETPMSAFFRAGASLTPSPVMATTSPRDCRARMILSLCSGDVRAKMETRPIASASSASLMWSSWSPLKTGEPRAELRLIGMPSLLPMATAVVSASPVIMITFTPPAINRLIERSTPLRGGSAIPTSPAKQRPLYISSFACASDFPSGPGVEAWFRVLRGVAFLTGPEANESTLRPSSAIFWAADSTSCLLLSSNMTSPPVGVRYVSHRPMTRSRAPLM